MTTGAVKKSSGGGQKGERAQIPLPDSLMHHRDFLFNRELSWLEFNRRVLEEALDRTQPLLERLKFLSIFSTNLDEFFMIRVSGLKEELDEEVSELSPDGRTPAEQLREIGGRLRPMLKEQARCLLEDVLPELEAHGISVVPYDSLTEGEGRKLDEHFVENVLPVLTPQAVDPGHPFPYVSNLSLNLGLMVETADERDESAPRFARIKIPPSVPRLVPVDESKSRFALLEELIFANAAALFPGMRAGESHTFRVTRDADIEIREDEADDLLRVMQQQLRRRRFGTAVRLEVASTMPAEMVGFLRNSIGCDPEDVYVIDGPLNVPDLMVLYGSERPGLKDKPLQPAVPPALQGKESIFDALKRGDVLLHHPYTSYSVVTDFINAAAEDPEVLAIKICLYRTGKRSPVVQALMEASERGKQVAALVELKARFDEENNIEWARRLERSGVHVIYGLLGLKTHCKIALVVRREGGALRRYVHIATGNYNPTTSRIYTDVGLLTANAEIGADATDLFNYLTGYSRQSHYRRLLVAPVNLRRRMTELIEREAAHARAGRSSRVIVKINSLTDVGIIRALYAASQAGVEIDLIVRGICALRPGVPGLSEHIKVTSIVGRFLEHSRVFYFANGGDEELFIGSADWMSRNLDRRVEVVAPVLAPDLKRCLKEDLLNAYLRDNVKARRLQPDGSHLRVEPAADEAAFDAQALFGSHAALPCS